MRRKTAAMPTVYDLIAYGLDLDIPNEIMAGPTIQKLLLYCNDICGWTNVSNQRDFLGLITDMNTRF
jgi:hypothetical protein